MTNSDRYKYVCLYLKIDDKRLVKKNYFFFFINIFVDKNDKERVNNIFIYGIIIIKQKC